MKKQIITVIGGGTGSYNVLRGLVKYDEMELNAIVSMMDSGGSSGILRDEFGFLPIGDIRRCLVALSPEGSILRKLFEYRFKNNSSLEGHSLGNLFLTALRDITDDEQKTILWAGKVLNIKGMVIPVTVDNCQLVALLENGQTITGETNIDIPKHDSTLRIKKVFLTPGARLTPVAKEAILNADKIIIGPGDLYTSILPNILVGGIKKAITNSKAVKIYICNIMTKKGETSGFKAIDFVKEMERYLGNNILDYIICNNGKPPMAMLKKYRKEGADLVGANLKKSYYKTIKANLLDNIDLARHDPDRLAEIIVKI